MIEIISKVLDKGWSLLLAAIIVLSVIPLLALTYATVFSLNPAEAASRNALLILLLVVMVVLVLLAASVLWAILPRKNDLLISANEYKKNQK